MHTQNALIKLSAEKYALKITLLHQTLENFVKMLKIHENSAIFPILVQTLQSFSNILRNNVVA